MNEDGSSKDSRYASYAEHPDRLEKMSVSVTYRTGERLFTATSLRGIVRNPDDSVVGLEPAHPETLRVRPHRGNGRLDSILGARTRTAKQRAEAAELLQAYPGLFKPSEVEVLADQAPDADWRDLIEAEMERRAAATEAMIERNGQPIH